MMPLFARSDIAADEIQTNFKIEITVYG